MSEEEVSTFGRLRKNLRCGPVSMFEVYVSNYKPFNFI